MKRFGVTDSSLNGAILRSVSCGLGLLSGLTLASLPASAMPVADGSKCNPNWVNNGGAMQCMIQGEDEANAGVSHPHYVACSAAGEIFCCVDDNKGAQNCVAEDSRGRATLAQQLGAILNGQNAIMAVQRRMSEKVDRMESKMQELSGKAPK